MKKELRKLTLTRETLRSLDPQSLQDAQGAATNPCQTISCSICYSLGFTGCKTCQPSNEPFGD